MAINIHDRISSLKYVSIIDGHRGKLEIDSSAPFVSRLFNDEGERCCYVMSLTTEHESRQ
jgi:hypothetical protein